MEQLPWHSSLAGVALRRTQLVRRLTVRCDCLVREAASQLVREKIADLLQFSENSRRTRERNDC